MRKTFRIYAVLMLLFATLAATAQDVAYRRGCRTHQNKTGVPAHFRMPRQAAEAGDENPLVGDRRQLLVLVSFNDLKFQTEDPISHWTPIFNAEDYREGKFVGSVHDYFYAQSYGQLNLTFDLVEVQLSEDHKKYRSTQKDDDNSKYLVTDIMDILLQRNDIDWSIYDWNGDRYIEQLLILYAGKGSAYGNFSNDYDAIWPHQFWLSQHDNYQPITFTYNEQEMTIDSYCCVQELANNESTFGTICHEYSHCFGLPDFYNDATQYVGSWDLMDSGNYNGSGYCPPSYSAHERWLMGWLETTEINEPATITDMKANSEEPTAYLLRNSGWDDEYYIIENRQQTGWDASLPGSGVVIFHVDYDKDVWMNSYPNSYEKQRYTIFAANNRSQMTYFSYSWPYPYGSNNQLTDNSAPAATLNNANANGQKLMSKPITDIEVTDGLASFKVMGGATDIHSIKNVCEETPQTHSAMTVLYRMGPVSVVRCAGGDVKKVVIP
jgi:M6 family metalloprotease-like protein